jgi:hypothetical protein
MIKDINIGSDYTLRQNAEEIKLQEEAEKRNRDLTTKHRDKTSHDWWLGERQGKTHQMTRE